MDQTLPLTAMMDPPVPVLTLTPTTDTEHVRIHGKAARIWQAADQRFGRIYNIAFLFIDHTGERMQGVLPLVEYQRLATVFTEENIVEITRFTLDDNSADYQVVKHPYILSLTRETVVTVLPPNLYDIPRNNFKFVSFREIGVSITHMKAVMDIIGRIVGFGDIVAVNTTGQPSRVRGMYLRDTEGRTVELALWGNFVDQFDVDALFEQSKQDSIIIAANNAQIKYWSGLYGLKTYSGTRFHVDPAMKEIADYKALMPFDGTPITLHATAHTYNLHMVTSNRAEPIRLTMTELNGLYLDNYNQNHYQCAGVIISINNRFDWYYDSCFQCHRKMDRYAGQLWCDHCSTRRATTIPWYRIRIQVADLRGNAQFMLLGRFAEQIIGLSAQQLVAIQQQNRERTPAPLMNIIGKKYLFTVAGKQRNANQENRIYTIVDVQPLPPELSDFLPQPILHIEATPFIPGSSSTTPARAPQPTLPPPLPIMPPPGTHLNPTEQSSGTNTTGQDETLTDTHGKRTLFKEEENSGTFNRNIRRRLEFTDNPLSNIDSTTTEAGPPGQHNNT